MLQPMLIMFENVGLNLISVALLSTVKLLKMLVVSDLIRIKLISKLKQLIDCINKLIRNL